MTKRGRPRKRKIEEPREPIPVVVVPVDRCMHCNAKESMRTYKVKKAPAFISRYQECRKCGHKVNKIFDR